MKIKVNDKELEYSEAVDGFKIVEDLELNLDEVLAIKYDGEMKDLCVTVTTDTTAEIVTSDSNEGKELLRHSTAHVMAAAIKQIWPEAKLAIGPAVDDGFYYDIDLDYSITDQDLKKIEKAMYKIVKKGHQFVREDMSREDGLKRAESLDSYKTELITDLPEDVKEVSFYTMGDFVDLCRGPHVHTTKLLKGYKLMKVAGAYWRGDASNKQLQRVYGVVFPTKEELKEYLRLLEEAKKRDHKKIGKKLKLFSLYEQAPGKPFWQPNGLVIFNTLLDFWRKEHAKAGYKEVKTPIILNRDLWETSGHWENYRENMYTTKIDGEDFAIKPMNCPGGMLMYKEYPHSYKELPLRVGEVGLVHRHEMSGTLNGLFRVRQFHQDDAHIFMTPEQIKDEILGVLNLAKRFYEVFGLGYHLELSTRPEKSVGSDEQWEMATNGLRDALDATGEEYVINEGDGAFYGPKIDIHLKDAIGRTWQCGTIQLDMSLPERFDLTYTGDDGENKHRPVMIHRVIYGSLERFIGILIEHYAGKFPLWLSPVQVKILTVADKFNDYAKGVEAELLQAGFRVEADFRSESISKKVREAQLAQNNYILVIGEKEQENKTINVRTRDNEVHGEKQVVDLIAEMNEEIENKN